MSTTRGHRDTYRKNDTVRRIDLGFVQVKVDSTNATGGIEASTKAISDDSTVMRVISDRMVKFVRDNILTGDFMPLLPATVARRKYPFLPLGGIGARTATGGSRPLVAGRSLVDNIAARSKRGYAAAQRGNEEWYGFLHDGGVGRVDRRTFMTFDSSQQDVIADVYEDWLTRGLDA